MHWLYLAIAILSEVAGSSALPAAQGFRNPLPSAVVVTGYVTAFYFLSLTLEAIPLGVAYAVWSGVGLALISAIGWIFYRQALGPAEIAGILLIGLGVVVLNLGGSGHAAAEPPRFTPPAGEGYTPAMKAAPNKTILTGRLKTYTPAPDGYGGEVEIEVAANVSPEPGGDFLKPQPGATLRAFTPQPKEALPLGADVTAELTFLGGPRGGRAVLQSVTR